MTLRPRHPRATRTHPARASVIDGPALSAMRTAERVFAAAADTATLFETAAEALAIHPGQMCLISLVHRGVLRPVSVTHVGSAQSAELRRLLVVDFQNAPADAFSRAVQRTGGSLRMHIANPNLLRLWLPPAYSAYGQRVRVGSVLATALPVRRRVLGTILLWREGDASPRYSAADQAYVAGLAVRLALALDPSVL